jgi:hypothetical protein
MHQAKCGATLTEWSACQNGGGQPSWFPWSGCLRSRATVRIPANSKWASRLRASRGLPASGTWMPRDTRNLLGGVHRLDIRESCCPLSHFGAIGIRAMMCTAFEPGRSVLHSNPKWSGSMSTEVTDGWYIGKYPETLVSSGHSLILPQRVGSSVRRLKSGNAS